jgi:hypothetical protein
VESWFPEWANGLPKYPIAPYPTRMETKVLGFVLEKISVPTELDEFRENSDEFRTQFGEISECKV